MQYLDQQLRSSEIGLAYTYRKGRLDIQFRHGDIIFLLSWEKKGNQVILTSTQSPTLPRRRVAVLRSIPPHSIVQDVQIHSRDKLLRLNLSNNDQLIFGAYAGASNVYYLSDGVVIESFLKKDELPQIDNQWLSPTDPLPATIPGGHLTPAQLLSAQKSLSMDWKTSTIIFGESDSDSSMNISEFVIDVLKHGDKPKQTPTASIQKTARTVLKRWNSKQSKIEAELLEAKSWPELQIRLQGLQIALGMAIKSSDGQLHIPAELSPSGEPFSIRIEENVTLQQAIESTAKKIRKYQGKLIQLQDICTDVEGDIKSLVQLLEQSDEQQLLKFLQDHGESLDRAGKQQIERKPFKKYHSPSGFDILVGRSSQDNDTLTFKVASKNDWWFHARQVRGSHVILRTGSQTPQAADIKAAAEHAALNSKAKHSGLVVVQYCQRKHLSKPKGAHPGAVLVQQEQSITINLN